MMLIKVGKAKLTRNWERFVKKNYQQYDFHRPSSMFAYWPVGYEVRYFKGEEGGYEIQTDRGHYINIHLIDDRYLDVVEPVIQDPSWPELNALLVKHLNLPFDSFVDEFTPLGIEAAISELLRLELFHNARFNTDRTIYPDGTEKRVVWLGLNEYTDAVSSFSKFNDFATVYDLACLALRAILKGEEKK